MAVQTEVISGLERRLAGGFVKSVFLRNRRGRDWPPPPHLRHVPVTLAGNTGARLSGLFFPHPMPRGIVVLAHPDRRYGKAWFTREGWIDWLHEHGFEVLTFDFVGYGASRGPATYYHEDVLAAARWARREAGGLPVHVVGLSMGAFAVANASPRLGFVQSIALESPYPSFEAWYGRGPGLVAMRAFSRLFPRTAAAIRADRNIAAAAAPRILVTLCEGDPVTAPRLSEAVAAAAPAERTRVLRIRNVDHLEPFARSPTYRDALLAHLEGDTKA